MEVPKQPPVAQRRIRLQAAGLLLASVLLFWGGNEAAAGVISLISLGIAWGAHPGKESALTKADIAALDRELPIIAERILMAVRGGLDIVPALRLVFENDNLGISQDVDGKGSRGSMIAGRLFTQALRRIEHGESVERSLKELAACNGSIPCKHLCIHLAACHRDGGQLVASIEELSDATQQMVEEQTNEFLASLPIKATAPLVVVFVGLLISFLAPTLAMMKQNLGGAVRDANSSPPVGWHGHQRGAGILFTLAALVPLCFLAGLYVLDFSIDARRARHWRAVADAQAVQQSRLVQREHSVAHSLASLRGLAPYFTGQVQHQRQLGSSVRTTPVSIALVVAGHPGAAGDQVQVAPEVVSRFSTVIEKFWEQVERHPDLSCEVAFLSSAGVVRITGVEYQRLNPIQRSLFRKAKIPQMLALPRAELLMSESGLLQTLVLPFAKPQRQGVRILVLLLNPFSGHHALKNFVLENLLQQLSLEASLLRQASHVHVALLGESQRLNVKTVHASRQASFTLVDLASSITESQRILKYLLEDELKEEIVR